MANPNMYDPTQKPGLHTGIDDADLSDIQLYLEEDEDEADEEDLDVDDEDEEDEVEDEDDHLIHVNGTRTKH